MINLISIYLSALLRKFLLNKPSYTYFYKNPKTFQLESVDPSGLFILLGKCLHNKCCH